MKFTKLALLLTTLLGLSGLSVVGCGGGSTKVIEPTEQFQVPDDQAKRLEEINEKVRKEGL